MMMEKGGKEKRCPKYRKMDENNKRYYLSKKQQVKDAAYLQSLSIAG